MEIILKKEVVGLGHADDIVVVKTGYAVNYLIPQGFATLATPSAKKVLAENIRQRAHKEAKLVADALVAFGLNVDKKDITVISESVKELGVFEASVKCYKNIKGIFKFEIVAE